MTQFIIFTIGTVFGSFLGLVIDRFPKRISIVSGSSSCSNCKRKLKSIDLIPIFSQLLFWSKCRRCKAPYPWTYAYLEALTGLLFLAFWSDWIDSSNFLILLFSLILSFFDYQYQEIPLSFFVGFSFIQFFSGTFYWTGLIWILFAVIAERLPLKIGAGDFLYLFLISFNLNFISQIWVIQIASFTAITFILLKKKQLMIPFIPFLSIGYLVVLSWLQTH